MTIARIRSLLPDLAEVSDVPLGREIELPGRGATYVVDSGPAAPGQPTFVMLHGLASTGLLTWYPALEVVRQFGRVVVLDQRGHGQGIATPRLRLEDCADDVVALADELGVDSFIPLGFSMGSLVAQLVWRRHRDRTDGLVLCAGAARMGGAAAYRRVGVSLFAGLLDVVGPTPARLAAAAAPDDSRFADHRWVYGQFRATSSGAIMQAVTESLRFDSRSWIAEVDVPTSVVITTRDRFVAPRDQRWMARQIADSHVVTVDAGHACCTLSPRPFLPGLSSALEWVVDQVGRSKPPRALTP